MDCTSSTTFCARPYQEKEVLRNGEESLNCPGMQRTSSSSSGRLKTNVSSAIVRSKTSARRTWMDVTVRAALIGAAVLVYLDLKAEIKSVRVDLGNKIDRVETKVDEVRGYLKFNVAAPSEDPPPAEIKK